MSKTVIDYAPRYPHVHERLESHRFSVLVAHRRFGKSVLSINHLLKQACMCNKERGSYAYVGPLRNQAKVIAWAYLKHYAAPIPNVKINESELSVCLPNGAHIRIFGADNPDALRGLYFDGIVLDEVAQMKAEVWFEIVQPALADRLGWALFIGTPKGINLFSDLYFGALEQMKNGNRDWYAMSFPVTSTKVLKQEEVDRLKEELSDNAFRQEMMCDFTASSDNILIPIDDVHAAMARHVHVEDMREWPLVVGVDVARYGEDATVFFPRRGLLAYSEPMVLRKMSNVEVAHKLIEYIAVQQPSHVFIDQGQGTGVIDLVRSLCKRRDVQIHEIPFGSKASDSKKYANKRSEMWVKMRDWIRAGGSLPNNQYLEAELTAPTYSIDAAGRIVLEKKDDIKKRLRRSTDFADSLALTFSIDLPATSFELRKEYMHYGYRSAGRMTDYVTSGENYKADEGSVFSHELEEDRRQDDEFRHWF